MKREIKFRAWDGDKKEMHLPEYTDKEDFHILADGTIVETHEHGYERHELTSRRPDSWVLMQYTGIKDKNGKEIYEGDVVTLPDTESESVDVGIGVGLKVAETPVSTIAEVVFLNGGFVFKVTEGGEIWQKGLTSFHNTDYTGFRTLDNSELEKEVEVIGNIHENKELL